MWKTVALATALALGGTAQAQTKKELVQKVLQLQQPSIEAAARQLAELPAAQMMQRAGMLIQARVPADKREALAKDIQADARRYAEEAVPVVRERAVKLAPTTIGPVLEERFSEDELKQLIGILESPVSRKFQQLGNEMQRALGEKLIAETRPTLEPKLKALDQSITKRITAVASPAAGSAASAPKK
jgi:hypothetical protein